MTKENQKDEVKTIHYYIYGLLPLDDLKNLPTHRLLAYYKKKHPQIKMYLAREQHLDDSERVYTDIVIEYLVGIRRILNQREHIAKK